MTSNGHAPLATRTSTGGGTLFASAILSDRPDLCFNHEHFEREQFEVSRFMSLARRRAPLKQIHNDLRLYLKYIQNAMIELINNDYADFVHLSSNLVALRAQLDKLAAKLDSSWSETTSSTSGSVERAVEVVARVDEVVRARDSQAALRAHLSYLEALKTLDTTLDALPTTIDLQTLETIRSRTLDVTSAMELAKDRLNEEEQSIWSQVRERLVRLLHDYAVAALNDSNVETQNREESNVSSALSLLRVAGGPEAVDALVAKIVSAELPKRISVARLKSNDDARALTDNMFDTVLQLRKDWLATLCRSSSADRPTLENFVDQCLLTYVLGFLDQRLTSVVVPSDPRLFHSVYSRVLETTSKWPSAGKNRTTLRAIRQKFNTVVYFKLVSQPLLQALNDRAQPERGILDQKEGSEFRSAVPRLAQEAVEKLWCDDVFLAPIADKCWDTTLKAITKVVDWMQTIDETARNSSNETLDQRWGQPAWRAPVAAVSDAGKLAENLEKISRARILPRLQELGVASETFEQILQFWRQELDEASRKVLLAGAEILSRQLTQNLVAVADVPKQYRWTKRPSPSSHSNYVDGALNGLQEFVAELERLDIDGKLAKEAIKCGLDAAAAQFVDRATQVVESVEAMGSSLARLKRTGNSAPSDSDDAKIRAQLKLDALKIRDALGVYAPEIGAKLEPLIQAIEGNSGTGS